MKFTLPYGKTKTGVSKVTIDLPDDIEVAELHPNDVETTDDPYSLLMEVLENPIGSVPPLEELVEDKENIVVVVDDYTRNFPRDTILIPFFDYLDEIGVSRDNVTIIIGIGSDVRPCHTIPRIGRTVVEIESVYLPCHIASH